MTTAGRIADLFGPDGQAFETASGQTFDDVCKDAGGERSGDAEVYKYIFVDGSVLTVAHDVWDFGYEECMCWHGAGHDPENCTATRMCDTFHLRGNE